MSDHKLIIHGFAGAVFDKDGDFICSSNAGKDFHAKSIIEHLETSGEKFVVTSFASILIDLAIERTAGAVARECFTRQELKNTPMAALDGKTPRDLLIQISAERRESIGPDWLVDEMNRKLQQYPESYSSAVITDVRRPAEAAFCREGSGYLVHVHRHVPFSRQEFLEKINLTSIDSATEQPLPVNPDEDMLVNNSFDRHNNPSPPTLFTDEYGVMVSNPDDFLDKPDRTWYAIDLSDSHGGFGVFHVGFPDYRHRIMVPDHEQAAFLVEIFEARESLKPATTSDDFAILQAVAKDLTMVCFNTTPGMNQVRDNLARALLEAEEHTPEPVAAVNGVSM